MKFNYANVQTGCVILTIDNERDLLGEALDIVRACGPSQDKELEKALQDFVKVHWSTVVKMAEWVWNEYDLDDVNWSEIREHYQTKVREGTTV